MVFVVCYRTPDLSFREKICGSNALFFSRIRSKLRKLQLIQISIFSQGFGTISEKKLVSELQILESSVESGLAIRFRWSGAHFKAFFWSFQFFGHFGLFVGARLPKPSKSVCFCFLIVVKVINLSCDCKFKLMPDFKQGLRRE